MSDMIRMSIDVPAGLHKLAKMTAAYRGQTIREFVIEQIRRGIPKKTAKAGKSRQPNRLTQRTLEKSQRGEDVFAYASYEDFLNEMDRK